MEDGSCWKEELGRGPTKTRASIKDFGFEQTGQAADDTDTHGWQLRLNAASRIFHQKKSFPARPPFERDADLCRMAVTEFVKKKLANEFGGSQYQGFPLGCGQCEHRKLGYYHEFVGARIE